MKFNGVGNQSVELRIANYQFPREIEDKWDSNWLQIHLKVRSNLSNWQTVDPSLTTWEVQSIIDWLEELLDGKDDSAQYLKFTEPNLEFRLLPPVLKLYRLRIGFHLESRPMSAEEKSEYFVDCELDHQEIWQAAEGLKAELRNYPER